MNERLAEFLQEGGRLRSMRPFALYPPALAGGTGSPRMVPGIMTGGRTFLMTEQGCADLDWAPVLHLDLAKLGWGDGLLEVRPEVKGAGTLFERTRIRPDRLEHILPAHPSLLESYRNACGADGVPVLLTSRATFVNRVIGGQSEKNAMQAVNTSAVQLAKSKIKFVPVWTAVTLSAAVHDNLEIVSRALPATMERFEGHWACEIRLSPGNVRAVYFDKARSDQELAGLCARVSTRQDELSETLTEMIADARRYLEIVATTTLPAEHSAYTWLKIGDINEKFENKSKVADFRGQRFAWFLAKDEIIVRRLGKFFTDMESYFGKDVGYASKSKADRLLHHELFALVVLRDHLRVCARFLLACELLGGRSVSHNARRSLASEIRRRIIMEVNASAHLELAERCGGLELTMRYPGLGGETAVFAFTAAELAEPWS